MITQNEIKRHKEEILKGFQLETTPTPKSLSALFFSGAISTFGIYSILKGMIEGKSLYVALSVFIVILGVADTFKRSSLAKYYNSIIRKKILENGKVLKLNLYVFFLALLFMVVFDIVGSFSTANYVEQKYKDFKATNSQEYKLLQDEAKEGKSALTIYEQELTAWENDKKDAFKICNEKWRGWKPKYKAKCKEDWKAKNPKPIKPAKNATVSIDDYKKLKEGANDDFLSKYIFYIVLFLSLAFTLLLQYMTVSEIQDKKDEIQESLTDMIIGILQDRLYELETNLIYHETQRNKLISTADKREKELNRKFEEEGKAIEILSLEKAIQSRGETVKRIANNQYIPYDRAKAGFIDVSRAKTVNEDEIIAIDDLIAMSAEIEKKKGTPEITKRYEMRLFHIELDDGETIIKMQDLYNAIKQHKIIINKTFLGIYDIQGYKQIKSVKGLNDWEYEQFKIEYRDGKTFITEYNKKGETVWGTSIDEIYDREKVIAFLKERFPQQFKRTKISKEDLIKNILNNVERAGDKIPPKTDLIDIENRRHKTIYEDTMKELEAMGVIEHKRGKGYFMIANKDDAEKIIYEAYN